MIPTKQTSSSSPRGGWEGAPVSREGTSACPGTSSIGIFGGSFNPIHNGHVALARQLLDVVGLDEIWFMVSPHNPLKNQNDLIDDNLRLKMTEVALKYEPQLKASGYEFAMPRPSYMWHTLQSLGKDYPGREFVLLIGADNWLCFKRWYEWRKILDNYRIVIYPRTGSSIDAASLPAGVRLVDTGLFDISSTEIRRKVKVGEPISHLVPYEVAGMVEEYYK